MGAARPRTVALVAAALAVLWAGLVLSLSQSSFAALLVGLAVLAALRWRPLAGAGGDRALAARRRSAVVVLAAPDQVGLAHRLVERRSTRSTSGRFDLIKRRRADVARPAGLGLRLGLLRRRLTASASACTPTSRRRPRTRSRSPSPPSRA